MSINMMTPQEAATHTSEIKKGWTSYRDILAFYINESQKSCM